MHRRVLRWVAVVTLVCGVGVAAMLYWEQKTEVGSMVAQNEVVQGGTRAILTLADGKVVESALNAGAEIIGVNNRNLKDFSVDLQNSLRLRSLVPRDKIFVSESGITCAADIKLLRAAGVNGFLIGEMLMRSNNITLDLQRLSGEIND